MPVIYPKCFIYDPNDRSDPITTKFHYSQIGYMICCVTCKMLNCYYKKYAI